MGRRRVSALFAVIAALSLVGAPVTMADWGEQASFSAEHIDKSQVSEGMPILQYENLSADAQNAVRHTIESPDGYYTVYGHEDWPDQFFYSDYAAPGHGMYAVVYEGQYYRFTTCTQAVASRSSTGCSNSRSSSTDSSSPGSPTGRTEVSAQLVPPHSPPLRS